MQTRSFATFSTGVLVNQNVSGLTIRQVLFLALYVPVQIGGKFLALINNERVSDLNFVTGQIILYDTTAASRNK